MSIEEKIEENLRMLNVDFSESEIGAWALKENMDNEKLEAVLSFVGTIATKKEGNVREFLIRLSHIPQKDPKLFSNFDTSRLPEESKSVVSTLKTLSFIPACRNIIMVGPTGTGKTHLAEAIGNECCVNSMKAYFLKMQELKEKFHKAILSGCEDRLIASMMKCQCLIIDEMGYCRMDINETRLFLHMVDMLSKRRKGSIVMTSNRDVSDWSEFFSDMDALECALDRLCDNALCISFSGDSYRGRNRTSVSLDFNNPIIRMGN